MSSSLGRKGLTVVCNIHSNLCNLMQRVKFSARVNQSNVNFALLKQLGQPVNEELNSFGKFLLFTLKKTPLKQYTVFRLL